MVAGSPWLCMAAQATPSSAASWPCAAPTSLRSVAPAATAAAGDDGLAGVDRDPGASGGERLDDGEDAPQLLLLRDGRGARASGLTAHVEPVRPVGQEGPAVGDGRGVVVELPSV